MQIKRTGKKVFGAKLTAAEQKAMMIEIRKQLAYYGRKHERETDAIVLWVLHSEFGFGAKRLRRFYDTFAPCVNELADRYELDDDDRPWICTYKLKEYGIDLEQWEKERGIKIENVFDQSDA